MSETWVDIPDQPLPPPGSWGALSLNQLLDLKNALLEKTYMARNKPAYLNPLNKAIAQIDGLISVKLADPRGAS